MQGHTCEVQENGRLARMQYSKDGFCMLHSAALWRDLLAALCSCFPMRLGGRAGCKREMVSALGGRRC